MIQNFSKANLPQIRIDINKLLQDYAKKNGITLDIGNITFTGTSFTAKLEAKVEGTIDPALERMMKQYNLKKNGAGGRELVAVNTRAYAYPFVYNQGGRRFKCSIESAKLHFGQ